LAKIVYHLLAKKVLVI